MPSLPLLCPSTDASLEPRLSEQVRLLGVAGCPQVGFAGGALAVRVQEEELRIARAVSWENGGWPLLRVLEQPVLAQAEAEAIAAGREILCSPDPSGMLWRAQGRRWRSCPPFRAGQGVALIGGSGCGKSTLAWELGGRLHLPVQDLDETIAFRAGKSIARIFSEDGEPAFRAQEVEVTVEAFQCPAVLALGGGAWESASIRATALTSGFAVLWIAENPDRVWRRVAQDPSRPLAQARELFMARWRARMPQWLEAPMLLPLGRSPRRLAEALAACSGS